MEGKLDVKDRKILYELDNNSRQPYSSIAKKVGLNKETCTYRINRMISEGIIKNFSTLIGLGNLGLFSHKIYFQLHGLTEEKKVEMIDDFQKNKKINWVVECSGEFDLIIAIICRNIKEFDEEKNKILHKYSDYIQEYEVGIMSETRVYNRAYLLNKASQDEMFLIGKLNSVELDEKDKKILNLIASNSRMTVFEIAQKTKLNVKTIISRIKKMESEKVIQKYSLFINLDKLGYKYFKAFISIDRMDKTQFNAFVEFCRNNQNIVFLVENVGNWELEPEFQVEGEEQFYDILNQMKNKFPEFIKKIKTVKIIKEYKVIYAPMQSAESMTS